MSEYHIPVLLKECIEGLDIKKNGVYFDLTFGGGGHSAEILSQLGPQGKLFGFDQDEDAVQNILKDERFEFIRSNFKYHSRFYKYYGISRLDGVLADLGISSYQIDEASRGFSIRYDADLDMRMNQKGSFTAADLLNTYSEQDLIKILYEYGEVKNSRKLSKGIVEVRKRQKFKSIKSFLNFLSSFEQGRSEQYRAKVFQALRIEVNDEMGALKAMLRDLEKILSVGSRVVVISYHSLEDRLVKRLFKTGNIEGKIYKDTFGNNLNPYRQITKRVVVPDENELKLNRRSRSAKLRIAEYVGLENKVK